MEIQIPIVIMKIMDVTVTGIAEIVTSDMMMIAAGIMIMNEILNLVASNHNMQEAAGKVIISLMVIIRNNLLAHTAPGLQEKMMKDCANL